MLRANYVRSVGPRQMVLTFTRALAEHLRSGPNVGRGDQLQKGEISTFMSWARSIIRNHGGTLPTEDQDFEKEREVIASLLKETIDREQIGELYDVIFVDEVQDFKESELSLIRALTRRVNFAGDSRQRIWKHREGLATAERMADDTVVLKRHYRIGQKICRYADQILPPKADQAALIDGCNYSERLRPSSAVPVLCSDEQQMIQQCIDKVKEELRYITDEPIGVIGPRNECLDNFMAAAERDPILAPITIRQKSNEYQPYDDSSRVRVMTVHSAKGSEFRAVHLLQGELFKEYNRELAFTAVTRAKTEAWVYHTSPLLGHMSPSTGQLPADLKSIF